MVSAGGGGRILIGLPCSVLGVITDKSYTQTCGGHVGMQSRLVVFYV